MTVQALVRPVIVLLLMLGASVLGAVAVPGKKLSETHRILDLETAVPKAFGDWTLDPSVVPLPPSPDLEREVKQVYDQVLSRTYVNSKRERVMLSIAYGSTQVRALRVHRQEICYAAQGFKISHLERPLLSVAGARLPATRLVATQGSRVESVTYWVTMGDQVVQTHIDREIAHLKHTLTGFIPDGYLVRVSSLSADPAQAYAQQIAFLEELFDHADGDLRRRLIGHA